MARVFLVEESDFDYHRVHGAYSNRESAWEHLTFLERAGTVWQGCLNVRSVEVLDAFNPEVQCPEALSELRAQEAERELHTPVEPYEAAHEVDFATVNRGRFRLPCAVVDRALAA